jgi:hypothetical protein
LYEAFEVKHYLYTACFTFFMITVENKRYGVGSSLPRPFSARGRSTSRSSPR